MENIPDHSAYIGIGSNMGNKIAHCRNGIAALSKLENTIVQGRSKFYRTAPMDYENQDWFVNAVILIRTEQPPLDLLNSLKAIEKSEGRLIAGPRFGPRPLDMDILLYDSFVLATDRLAIPHPRMHKRCFVLRPICDIDASVVHPVLRKEMRELLEKPDIKAQMVSEYP